MSWRQYFSCLFLLCLAFLQYVTAFTSIMLSRSIIDSSANCLGISTVIRPRENGKVYLSMATSGKQKLNKPNDKYLDINQIPIWEVPKELRREEENNLIFSEKNRSNNPYLNYYSLEDLFSDCDGKDLATLFDESQDFRHSIRLAMRKDLFVPDPTKSAKVNNFIQDINSSLHVKWDRATSLDQKDKKKKEISIKENEYINLSNVFRSYGLSKLDGITFIYRIGALCGINTDEKLSIKTQYQQHENDIKLNLKRFGSLIDIVNTGRYHLRHSWHQDCGKKDFMTVMLGFPRENNYSGAGVFSHCFKLSHRLTTKLHGDGNVIEYEQLMDYLSKLQGYHSLDQATSAEEIETIQERYKIPEKYILKPWYCKGKEIIIYDDSIHLHSAPNHIFREGIWRFM